MYVRAAAERSLSGTPMHLLLVDAPNRAVPKSGMFHARLEPLRAFISSYPMDGILRISEKCSRPIIGILSDTSSAFTDQPRLCCRMHRSLQHHPCFRAMNNLQPRIRRPRCYSSGATGTPDDPTTDSNIHALLSARVRPLGELFRSPFPFLLDFERPSFADHPRAFFSSGDYSTALFRTTPTQFDLRATSVTTYKFFFVGLFLLRPYSCLQI